MRTLRPAALALLLAGCTLPGPPPTRVIAQLALTTAQGAAAGEGAIMATGDTTALRLSVNGLPPGPHGLHLHAVGRCDAPDFSSAGPHLNPEAKQHGRANPAGSHLGDLPNLDVASDGRGGLTVVLGGTRDELRALLFDADGTAVVVHANADDYRTDPTGNSGSRIACGILTRV